MTKHLQAIIGKQNTLFIDEIRRLESATQHTGADIRFSMEIKNTCAQKIKSLGLDPHDTTAEELFHSLIAKAKSDEQVLRRCLGIDDKADSAAVLSTVGRYLEEYVSLQRVWILKRTVLKKALKEVPPIRTMKVFRARSIDSLLKRESVHEVYAVAYLVESDSYKQKLATRLSKVTARDLEEESLRNVVLKQERWHIVEKMLRKRTPPVVLIPEVGIIMILPASVRQTQCLGLLTAVLIVMKVQHCKVRAAYIKLRSLDQGISSHLFHPASDGRIHLHTISGIDVQWLHLYRLHVNESIPKDHYGPHITNDDVSWLQSEVILGAIDPRLEFWIDTHNLAYVSHDDRVVSFNIADVSFSAMFGLSCPEQHLAFVREAVVDELYERYLSLPPFQRMVHELSYKMTDNSGELLYA